MTKWSWFVLLFLLSACDGMKKKADFAGGRVSMCLESIDLKQSPESLSDYNTQLVYSQVVEGLVTLDPKDLSVKPLLAKKVDVLDGGKKFEFTLRDKVYFHDFGDSNSDRLFTAEDVVYSIKNACKSLPDKAASSAYILVYQNTLKGADDFFNGKTNEISGVKINGNKVTLELTRKDQNFLHKLSLTCCAIKSSKLVEKNDALIGTGPFCLMPENVSDERLLLVKNEDYYLKDKNGCALPYLDSLDFKINGNKMSQLELFEQKKIDLIQGLPASRITKMLEGRLTDFNSKPPVFHLYNNPQMVTNYYFFDMTDPRFKDKKVRQAFNYAIDKEKIGREILRNQFYEMGNYGIVPPLGSIFKGYNFREISKNCYYFNPEKARQLLAEAGFPNGKDFGSISLHFNINDVHSAVADEFAKQISRTLNINVNIEGTTFEQLMNDGGSGKGDIFRRAWGADYPSVESFLANFHGKLVPNNPKRPSPINQSRYQNVDFDRLFEKAQHEDNKVKRLAYFSLAEIELMKDPPIIPLWYNGELEIVYSKIRNLYLNSLDILIFKEVYLKDWTKEEFRDFMKKSH